jgi:hypothetical protein
MWFITGITNGRFCDYSNEAAHSESAENFLNSLRITLSTILLHGIVHTGQYYQEKKNLAHFRKSFYKNSVSRDISHCCPLKSQLMFQRNMSPIFLGVKQ